jgi:alpha-tubulin suppressor-like RCC1 family protein
VLGTALVVCLVTVLVLVVAFPAWFRDLTRQVPSQLAAGQQHTCVLNPQGEVRCWGANDQGQLGDATTVTRSGAVQVRGLAGVTSLAAGGGDHTCALTRDRTVVCWGRNDHGQLGNGTTASSSIPVPVTGLSGAVGLAVGRSHSCAVLADGEVRCWGGNGLGQLGDGSMTDSTTPVEVVGFPITMTAVTSSADSTCAITERGRVRCWGDNSDGQLATGTTSSSLVAVPATGLDARVTRVAMGDVHGCAVGLTGGVLCWGSGNEGRLGDGSTSGSRATAVPVPSLASGVAGIAAGYGGTCAVRGSAALCWGAVSGVSGTAGGTPVEVLPSGVRSVAVGGFHACALLESGGVRCWGANQAGQLGDGTTTASPRPVQVAGL